ncbi:MAG: hypothetical protein ACUVV3_10190 [Dehalococcoidia bacterium]
MPILHSLLDNSRHPLAHSLMTLSAYEDSLSSDSWGVLQPLSPLLRHPGQEAQQRLVERLGLLQVEQVAGVGDDLQTGGGDVGGQGCPF